MEMLKKIVEESSDLVCTLDSKGKILWINNASNKILAYTPYKLVGRLYTELIHEDDLKKWEKAVSKRKSGGNVDNDEIRHIHREGNEVALICSVLWDSREKKFFCIGKTISNSIESKNELQKLLDDATDLARIGGWEVELNTNTVYWSPMTKELHEVNPDYEPDLESAINFYREDAQEIVKKRIDKSIETGEPFEFEFPIITAKGRERWVKSIGKVEYKNDTPCRILGSIQDIHDRKIAELRLQNTADNVPGVIFQYILYPDGTDEISNLTKGAEDLWGFTADECMQNIDLIWNQTRADGDIEKVQSSIKISAETMEPWHCQYRSRLPDGKLLWHDGYGRPRKLPDGSILWDSLIVDITKTKTYEESLKKLNENLEQHAKELAISNSELEQFAFVISHDLQEPLRMISSFLTQLERKYGDQLDDKANQYIHFAVDGAKRMRQIILSLLDFSTIGKSVDLKESVDIYEIVEEACLMQRKVIDETGAVIFKENLPTILTQRAVIAHIFLNLIENAIKYRKDGVAPKVVISASETKEEWIFSIKDNGIGIDEEYFAKIFTIFQKLHSKDKYGGTGMGLAIVKKSIENLGGNIWVESTPGEGSNFIFSVKK